MLIQMGIVLMLLLLSSAGAQPRPTPLPARGGQGSPIAVRGCA